jgi:hypothetical protein
MTGFSKTELPCDCGWLSLAINDPQSGVAYNAAANQIALSGYPLYHCPFCGGRYPDPSKPMWVPIIPTGEKERLEHLIANLVGRDDILQKLGKPDYDELTYTAVRDPQNPEELVRDDSVPPIRNIEYYGLSDWFNVEFYVDSDGSTSRRLMPKMLSPRAMDASKS